MHLKKKVEPYLSQKKQKTQAANGFFISKQSPTSANFWDPWHPIFIKYQIHLSVLSSLFHFYPQIFSFVQKFKNSSPLFKNST